MGTSDRAIGDQYDAQVMSAASPQNYNLPAGLTPDQIAQPPEIQFKVGRKTAPRRRQADEVVRKSARGRCLRQRRAADAKRAAACRVAERVPVRRRLRKQ